MKTLDLLQGSAEWLAARLEYFTASEAPAMMGESKYISRTQLLDHKKGWTTEVDEFTQKLFAKGHKSEQDALPLVESLIDDELYPVVGLLEGTKLLASFDGLTMMEDVIFEHKLFSKVLAENVLNEVLEPNHYWQLEQQLLVSGADKVIFVTSDGTDSNWKHMFYESVPERREALIAGWAQFEKDLETHEPQAKAEKVVANEVTALPIISYEMNGMSLVSNLDDFVTKSDVLVKQSKTPLETDQDFADAEVRQKTFTKAESDIKALADKVLTEVADIDKFTRDLRHIGEQIRQARLAEQKQIKSRKEELRSEILKDVTTQYFAHLGLAFKGLGVSLPPSGEVSIAESMKGKKTVDSLKDAANTALSQIKIQIDEQARLVRANADFMQDYKDFKFLFNDWKEIAFKANDDFTALVKTRINEHKEAEQKKLDEQREQIRKEEQEKAEAKVQAEKDALAKVESDRLAKIKQDAKDKVEEELIIKEEVLKDHARDKQNEAQAEKVKQYNQSIKSEPVSPQDKEVTPIHPHYDGLKHEAFEAHKAAEKAWHTFASCCELGEERTWAFDVYETIRLATRKQRAA